MSDENELSDAQHVRLVPLRPLPSNHLKTPHLQVLDAWLYVLYEGCTWRGLAREFGNWHTIYVRLNRRAKAGVERLAAELQRGNDDLIWPRFDHRNWPHLGVGISPVRHFRLRCGRAGAGRSRSRSR